MKAVLWISFLAFAAFMAAMYYYYTKKYVPAQRAIAAEEIARVESMKAEAAAELAAKNAAAARGEPVVSSQTPKPAEPPKSTNSDSDLKISVPTARVITSGSGSIKTSLDKRPEKPKTPEEIAREKELAALRKLLRAAQAQANRGE